jgi:hypothetical protein
MNRRLMSTGAIACLVGACASGAVVAGPATEQLVLKTVINPPGGGKFTSFDISFVDTTRNLYILGDRTNAGVQVVNTITNQIIMTAGAGLFTGNTGNNNTSGPDGVMTVPIRNEIWAGDGDSSLKFLSLATGGLIAQVSTGGQFRVDEMCFDSFHNIGFVANNADSPPFITAVSLRTHAIIGQIFFDGTLQNGGGVGVNATDGVEQCQFNPRDGKIYVSVPEVAGPGDNSAPGAVARITPLTLQIEAVVTAGFGDCSGPQGMAIGPVVPTGGPPAGLILLGCNGAIAPPPFGASGVANPDSVSAPAFRSTTVIDDGSAGGTFGFEIFELDYQAGNDMVAYNGIVTGHLCAPNCTVPGVTGGDNHFYLARSGNNTFNNFNAGLVGPQNPAILPPQAPFYVCPSLGAGNLGSGAINYGGNIFTLSGGVVRQLPAKLNGITFDGRFAGPQVLGMFNPSTHVTGPDTITGLISCAPTSSGIGSAPGNPDGAVASGASNTHGSAHSVAADPIHNQIYVPIPSNAFATGMNGICVQKGGVDANGCIAVFTPINVGGP